MKQCSHDKLSMHILEKTLCFWLLLHCMLVGQQHQDSLADVIETKSNQKVSCRFSLDAADADEVHDVVAT